MNETYRTQLWPRLAISGSLLRALVILALASAPLLAQDRTVAAIGREEMHFADRVMLSSTLEIALLGVAGISDAQRLTVEMLEQQLRDSVAKLGEPIRRARRVVRVGWPAEPELIEREINAIAAVRQTVFGRMRDVLTPTQQERFDRNLLMIEDSDIFMWLGYAKPFAGTSTVGRSTP